MLRLFFGQLAVFAALLVLVDAVLWVVAPVSFDDQSIEIRQNLPGLKPKIKRTSIGGGLRSLSLSNLEKPNGSRRVLCLGASTTNQSTQGVEDTWCAILERQLKSKYPDWGSVFHTLSYGAGGNRALDTLVWLNARFAEIQPDIVITLLGINDLSWGGGPGYAVRDVDAALADGSGAMSRLKKLCKSVSQLCRRVTLVWISFRTSKSLKNASSIEWHSSNLPRLRAEYRAFPGINEIARDPDPIEEFEAATRRLLGLLRDRGVEVIVLGQPTIWKPDLSRDEFEALWLPLNTANGYVRPSGGWLLAEMRRYNDVQRKLANQNEMMFVDLDTKIPKDLEHYFDDCHYTDKGSQAVAELVLPSLERIIAGRTQPRSNLHSP